MITRTNTIDSPECVGSFGVCPYHERHGNEGVCWGVDDDLTNEGCPRICVDRGENEEPQRYSRHVECPFGTRQITVTISG